MVWEKWKIFVGVVLTFKMKNVKILWMLMKVMRIAARTKILHNAALEWIETA